jgi:hypothetical protein
MLCSRQVADVGLEVGAQRVDVAGPVVGLTQAVEAERHLAQAERR